MKINRAELLNALEKVRPGLATKEVIEQSTSFAFMGDRVVTYNDEISVSHPVKGLDVTGAVKAQTLYGYLNKVKQDDIDVVLEENQVIIKAGRAKAGLVLEHEVVLPVEEIGKIGKWHPLPEEAIKALQFCYPCCSKDMSRAVLSCVHVTPELIESSDSYQIAVFHLSKKLPITPFLLPAAAARALVQYKVKEISVGDSWVHFRTEDGTIFSSRVFSGEFPDTSQYMNPTGKEFTFPKNMKDILQRADVFAQAKAIAGSEPTVIISLSKGKLHASVESDSGWFKEVAKAGYDGPPVKFSVVIEFLMGIFNETMTCIIGENLLGFKGEKWQHLIAMTANVASSDDAAE